MIGRSPVGGVDDLIGALSDRPGEGDGCIAGDDIRLVEVVGAPRERADIGLLRIGDGPGLLDDPGQLTGPLRSASGTVLRDDLDQAGGRRCGRLRLCGVQLAAGDASSATDAAGGTAEPSSSG